MNDGDEDNLPEDSDSDDEDFMPGAEPKQDLSEEEDDGDEEITGKKSPKKRKNGKFRRSRIKSKKRKGAGESDEESDDEDDVDFVLNEKVKNVDDDREKAEDPEVVAARDKAEKARTDLLWADFLNSVETSKSKKNQNDVEIKTITKVYDFAGEKVEVQEKVKVTAEDSETRSSTSSSISTGESSGSTSDFKKLNANRVGSSSSLNGSSSKTPGSIPGQAPEKDRLQLPRKTRISFLSGDPADIGLAGDRKVSAREGLANVLNALHARNKKMGTLEKSKLDWETYKHQEGLQEELHGHTKSKHGYIDKQEFLQRSDLRQFEIEKEARSKRRRNP